MKKISAIILAILMIAVSIPFATAAESYEITHQPVSDELYVETNDKNATYQWYGVTEGYVIDYTTAESFDPDTYFGTTDYYRDEARYSGDMWLPSYNMVGIVYEMYFFEVSLKKGETVTVEFIKEISHASFVCGTDNVDLTVVDGKTGTYTAENDGIYALQVYGPDYTGIKASSDGKLYTAVEGEASAKLNNPEEGRNYVCYVTFSDGTVAVSDEVSGHNHTGTELVCTGCICSVCGEIFGEETAEVHSFTSYTQTTAPSCTESGAEEAMCDYGCGKADVKVIPTTNHEGTLVQKDAAPATCTEAGHKAYEYCTVCDYTTYEEIPAGHTPVEEVRENVVAPDCGNKGSYDLVVYCGVCEDELVRITISVAAVDHKDADGDYMCDYGCGYEFERPEEPAPEEPEIPDEPAPDVPAEDEVCAECGKVHNGFFDDFVCFFIMIFNSIAKIFA